MDPLPLLCVEDGKDVLVGHETFFHITDFEVVQGQHVLLLLLLRAEGRGIALDCPATQRSSSQNAGPGPLPACGTSHVPDFM